MKKLSLLCTIFWACLMINPSRSSKDRGSSEQVLPIFVNSMESLTSVTSSQYTNVFIFICPDESFESDSLDEFRGCHPFMSRVIDVVASFMRHPVVNLRFGVGVASTNSPLAKSYRLDGTQTVLYARKNHFGDTYVTQFVGDLNDPDMDEMFLTMWARDNSHSFIRDLTEENFEHLTQASSGATTGDWLVAFGTDAASWKDAAAARLALDTVAAEYKHQLSVAFVDIKTNPKLAERFRVISASTSTGNPLILRYFRLEKMYSFDLDKLNFQTLRAFVTGGYRHVKSEKVPTEPTPFDQLVESVVARLKQFGHPSFVGTFILILAFTAAMSILIVLACCASKESKDQDTKFKKG